LLEDTSFCGYSYTALPTNVWTELQYTFGMCRATHGVRIDSLSTGKCRSQKFDHITYQQTCNFHSRSSYFLGNVT
jgi:hypothetical protein